MPATTTTPILLKPIGGSSLTIGTSGVAGKQGIQIAAIIRGGGTAGNVQIQYAQVTADAGACILIAGRT
jgi:hypothetical protein